MPVPVTGKVGVVGKRWKRWADPGAVAELAEAEGGLDVLYFWRTPVFKIKLERVPVFLLPRLGEMAAEVPNTDVGRRIYYARINCLLVLAYAAKETDLGAFRFTEPPAEAERHLGSLLGQAFHQGCSLADIGLATGLSVDQIVTIGRRTIRGTKWLSRITGPKPA